MTGGRGPEGLPSPADGAKAFRMKQLSLVGMIALAGCAGGGETVLSPVQDFNYGALGRDPFWIVAIGDDRIVLTLGREGGRADGKLATYLYPRALPRETDGARHWESGTGTQVIAIKARPGPCAAGGRTYPDRVTVTLSGRMLEGCGGRESGIRG